jgi:hypothetical protein
MELAEKVKQITITACSAFDLDASLSDVEADAETGLGVNENSWRSSRRQPSKLAEMLLNVAISDINSELSATTSNTGKNVSGSGRNGIAKAIETQSGRIAAASSSALLAPLSSPSPRPPPLSLPLSVSLCATLCLIAYQCDAADEARANGRGDDSMTYFNREKPDFFIQLDAGACV